MTDHGLHQGCHQFIPRGCSKEPLIPFWTNRNFEFVGFCKESKTREPGEKLLAQGDNQQQTQPTNGAGSESNAGHLGEGRVLLCFVDTILNTIILTSLIFFMTFRYLSHLEKGKL